MRKELRDCLKQYCKIQIRASEKRTAISNQMIAVLILVILLTILSMIFL